MSLLGRSAALGSSTLRLFSSTNTGLKNLVVCRSYSARLISQTVKSLEQYEALKTNQSDLLVGWFTAKWSTAGKLFEGDFEKLAEQFPQVWTHLLQLVTYFLAHFLQMRCWWSPEGCLWRRSCGLSPSCNYPNWRKARWINLLQIRYDYCQGTPCKLFRYCIGREEIHRAVPLRRGTCREETVGLRSRHWYNDSTTRILLVSAYTLDVTGWVRKVNIVLSKNSYLNTVINAPYNCTVVGNH